MLSGWFIFWIIFRGLVVPSVWWVPLSSWQQSFQLPPFMSGPWRLCPRAAWAYRAHTPAGALACTCGSPGNPVCPLITHLVGWIGALALLQITGSKDNYGCCLILLNTYRKNSISSTLFKSLQLSWTILIVHLLICCSYLSPSFFNQKLDFIDVINHSIMLETL